MVVVGYGPTDSSSTPYWILKNRYNHTHTRTLTHAHTHTHLKNALSLAHSYGTGWGIDGYMHMVRNRNMCGIAVDAGYPIV